MNFISMHTDERIYAIAEALRKNATVDEIYDLTKIDRFFLDKVKKIVELEKEVKDNPWDVETFIKAKKSGFADSYLAKVYKSNPVAVYNFRK